MVIEFAPDHSVYIISTKFGTLRAQVQLASKKLTHQTQANSVEIALNQKQFL